MSKLCGVYWVKGVLCVAYLTLPRKELAFCVSYERQKSEVKEISFETGAARF